MNKDEISELVRKATNNEKYGEDYPNAKNAHRAANLAHTPKAREKRIETLEKRYGVNCAWKIPGIGHICTELSDETKEKIKQTMLERYSVDCGFKLPQTKKNAQTPEAWAKRCATLRKSGKTRTSSQEERVYKALCSLFDSSQIQRNADNPSLKDKRTTIDFLVVSAIYIQIDGVYWHGLDRDIELIKQSSSPRDKAIYRKYLRDRQLDEFVIKNQIKFFRMTDIEINNLTDKELKEALSLTINTVAV